MLVSKIIIFLLNLINLASAKLFVDANWKYPLDRELFERVLDPEQCEKQLNYIRRNDSFLLTQFIDAGLRVPRGILLGNFKDYGLYPQCLGIHEVVSDMTIDGKWCLIRVPANQNVQTESVENVKWNFNPNKLVLNDKTAKEIKKYRSYMKTLKTTVGKDDPSLDLDRNTLSNIEFSLAICIPKVCTTQETLSALLFNITALGFKYEDDFCRLPNDRPWVAADYVATVVFSILGLLTLLSTGYDVYHNVICKKDPKRASVVLMSFSAYTNCRRLLSFKANPNAIQCLDGIRALATFWVVIGHVFFIYNSFIANPIAVYEWIQSYHAIWIMYADISVDTFFLLSGILLVYTTAGKLTANQLMRNLPIFYLNRLLRIFPVLAAVILFESSFYNRLGDGPIWGLVLRQVQRCRTFWWTTLLHVQNFVNPDEACIGVSWYLAIDTNLHILSPIILFFVLGTRKVALIALGIALLISLTASTVFIFVNEFTNYYASYYVNVLTRAPPFFVGLVYGYVLNLWRGKRAKIPLLLGNLITTFAIALIAVVIYCRYLQDQSDFNNETAQHIFDSFLRPAWALGLGWIIFHCAYGHGGPINWFLSLNVWKIPSRISYAMYLSHISLMRTYYSSALEPVYFTVPRAMFHFMAFFAIVLQTSFFITALIDAPFAILFRIVLTKAGSKKSLSKKTNEDITVKNNISDNETQQAVEKREDKQF